MRWWFLLFLVPVLVALASSVACERVRTRNSSGGLSSSDEAAPMPTLTNVYRFVGVEKALRDARKAAVEERWGDGLAAARALLEQEPGHIEAQRLAAQAELESTSQAAYTAMKKALVERSTSGIAANFRNIGAESRYLEAARPDYEKIREQWVVLREAEARGFVRAGRCRDAYRVARSANELFPEMRPRLDVAAESCEPASGQDKAEAEPRPPSAPVASLDPRPPASTAPTPQAAERPDAGVAAAVVVRPPIAPAALVAAPEGAEKPRLVAAIELEKLRIAGDKRPSLPAGARMIATRDHVGQIIIGVSYCLDASGTPSQVQIVKPAAYDDANEKVLAELRRWRFKPFTVGDKPSPVCTRQMFIYQME